MKTIGQTKIEAIDWVQEKLDYSRRDVAEITLFMLIEDGLAQVSDEGGVILLEEIPEGELREKSRMAMKTNDMKNRIMRRRAISPNRNHRNKITSLNYIDSDEDNTATEDNHSDHHKHKTDHKTD